MGPSDVQQAQLLEAWLAAVLADYGSHLLTFDSEAAQVWGRLRVTRAEHELDKQIAAIALVNDLTVVTRNTADFEGTGVKVMNPLLPTCRTEQTAQRLRRPVPRRECCHRERAGLE